MSHVAFWANGGSLAAFFHCAIGIVNDISSLIKIKLSEKRMVFYFTCQSRPDLAEKYIIYMGRDKFDNEALIQ